MISASRPGLKKKEYLHACEFLLTYNIYKHLVPYLTKMPTQKCLPKMPMYKTVGTNKLTVVRISDTYHTDCKGF